MHTQFTQIFLSKAADILYEIDLRFHLSIGTFEGEPAILLEAFTKKNAIHNVVRGRVKMSILLFERLGWNYWIVPIVEGEQCCCAWRCDDEATRQQS